MIYDLSTLTLTPEEASDVKKAVFEKVFTLATKISEYHAIVPNVNYDQHIPIVGNLGIAGRKWDNCKPTANPNKLGITRKTWQPRAIGDRFEHCINDVNALFSLFKKSQRDFSKFYSELNNDELGIIEAKVSDEMAKMLDRLVWFGDTTASNVTAGGSITDGTGVQYFNAIDGLWKQIIADVPSTSDHYVKIDANDGTTTANQKITGDNFAYELFSTMWTKADARLKGAIASGEKAYLHVSGDIAENYMNFKEKNSLNFTLTVLENGNPSAKYKNIDVVPRYDWDANISAYQNNGTKLNLPNRAILTTSGNIPLGTTKLNTLNKLESFYSKYEQVNVVDFILKFDVKFLEPYMAVVAY